LLLLQLADVTADDVSGRGASSDHQKEKKESADNHGFLTFPFAPRRMAVIDIST